MKPVHVMPKKSFPVEEGDLRIQDIGGNVFMEIEGDCWYASISLPAESVAGLHEWLSCYLLGSKE